MNHFLNRRSKRNTAFALLLVWLFAVASGIANACVLKTHGDHAGVVATEAFEAVHAHSALVAQTVAAEHDDELDVSKAPCLKVCDDGTKLLIKQQTSLDLDDPSPVFPVSVLWTAVIPVVTFPGQRDGLQAIAHGPPIRVRYSRLTL